MIPKMYLDIRQRLVLYIQVHSTHRKRSWIHCSYPIPQGMVAASKSPSYGLPLPILTEPSTIEHIGKLGEVAPAPCCAYRGSIRIGLHIPFSFSPTACHILSSNLEHML